MIKIIVLILCFGLSTLTSLLLFSESWQIAVGIVGLGLGYIVALVALLFLIATLLTLGVSGKKTTVKYGSWYRKLFNFYSLLLLSLFGVKLTVNGLDKVPNDSSFVLLQNHLSNVDPIFTNYVFKKHPLIFVSKASLFKIPFFGKTIKGIGYVKLSRTTGMNDASEIIRGLRWVRAEECSLAVYPEGKRNKTYPDPILLDYSDDILAIAMKSEKPIVISTILGTENINDKLLLKVHKIQVDVLGVIELKDYVNLSPEELSQNIRKVMLDNIQNPSKKQEKVRLF